MSSDTKTRAAVHPSVQRLYKLCLADFNTDSPTHVADIILQSTQTLHNWARGRGVSKPGAKEIERNLGWSAKYIREGTPPERVKTQMIGARPLAASTIVPPRLVRKVPIVGQLRYEETGGFVYAENPHDNGDCIAAFTNGEPGRAYTVRHDKLLPRYRAGEHVVVAPRLTPEHGDDVVIFLKDAPNRYALMRFMREVEEDIEVLELSSNASHTIARERIASIEKVIGCYSNFARISSDAS